jgi:hypothetical protein
LPAWRVAFADPDKTSVFVAANTGQIAAVRTANWRLFDFFWGLHIMDWTERDNFNTWWLLALAVGGLVMGLAGTVLLVMRWPISIASMTAKGRKRRITQKQDLQGNRRI